jgi:transcriptional regulator
MLEQPVYALGALAEVRDLVHANAWALIASAGGPPSGGGSEPPVISHLPVLLDPDESDATILTHLPREDADLHRLGERDVVIVVEGPNNYISPSWYSDAGDGPYVPTWNYTVAHLHGRPEVFDDADTYRVLELTVEHFEKDRPAPWRLDSVDEYAHSIAPYAVGFRLRPTRIASKGKLSQDKPAEVIERVIDALESDLVHANPPLARLMRDSRAADRSAS